MELWGYDNEISHLEHPRSFRKTYKRWETCLGTEKSTRKKEEKQGLDG